MEALNREVSVPTPTPSGIVTPTPGGTCFSAVDDEAAVVKKVAGSGGSEASGSHGPLDLDPAPCGGAKGAQEAKAIPLMASGPSEIAEATVPSSSTAAEAIPDQDRVHPSRKFIKNKKMSGASGGLCLPKAHHQLKQVITPQCPSEAASSSGDDMLEVVCYF